MESLFQNFIKAFGWSILNSFWQCGIIYGILLISLLCFPKWTARTRHNLSYLSLSAMFIWFCATFVTSFRLPGSEAAPVTLTQFQLQQYAAGYDPSGITAQAEAYFPFIILAYTLGFLLQVFLICKGYYEIHTIRKSKLEKAAPQWQMLFEKVIEQLGISQKVNFKISSLVKVPLVIGYFKPLVLFPVSHCSYLDTEQVEAILIHELTHIRRNDYLLNLIKATIETVLFFNPFVWMTSRFIQIEREHACDDMVLKFTGKPVSYAEALLKLEIFTNKPGYAMAATGKAQNLLNRIKRITNMKTNYLNLKQQMAALTLLLACFISFAWVRPTENKKAKESATETKKVFSELAATTGFGLNNVKQLNMIADTIKEPVKKENKIKIIVTDDDGNKKEYNSVSDLPDSLKTNFKVFKSPGSFPGVYLFNGDSIFLKNFKIRELAQVQDELAKKFSSPEWKKQQQELARSYSDLAKDLAKKFNSAEWKKQQQKLAENYADLAKKLNSDEFKKLKEQLSKNYSDLAEVWTQKFNSSEWKTQEDFRDLYLKNYKFNFDSLNILIPDSSKNFRIQVIPSKPYIDLRKFTAPGDSRYFERLQDDAELRKSKEYKKLREKFEKDVEKLRKKEAKKNKKPENIDVLFDS